VHGVFRKVASAALEAEAMNDPSSCTGPGPASETAAVVNNLPQPNASGQTESNIPGLTVDQVQRLLNLSDVPQPGYEKLSGKFSWMLDSGASCHMVGDRTMLSGVKQIAPVTIGLPNGAHTTASEMGLTRLAKNLQLENVLYVPNLKCNLVSTSKLCKQFNCKVTLMIFMSYRTAL